MHNLHQSPAGPQGNREPPERPWWAKLLPWLFLAFLVLAWFLPALLGQGGSQGNEAVTYSTFVGQVAANNVQVVTISDYTITGVFKAPVLSQDGKTKSTQFTTAVPQFGNSDLMASPAAASCGHRRATIQQWQRDLLVESPYLCRAPSPARLAVLVDGSAHGFHPKRPLRLRQE